jgi:hypothetical protein
MRLGFSVAAIALALPAQALDRVLEETVSFTGSDPLSQPWCALTGARVPRPTKF